MRCPRHRRSGVEGGDVISPILKKYGKYDLLAFMNKYWKALVSYSAANISRIADESRALRLGFLAARVLEARRMSSSVCLSIPSR